MDATPFRRPSPSLIARSPRRQARLAAALFWAAALLLVGARVVLHDEIAAGAPPAPHGIVSTDPGRAG